VSAGAEEGPRRVLVPLGPGAEAAARLAAAVDLARALQLELRVIYLEDRDLEEAVTLPFAREVARRDGGVRRLARPEIERRWREQVAEVRREIERAVRGATVRWQLEVRRGRLAGELAGTVEPRDVVLLGREALRAGRTARPAAPSEAALVDAPAASLLLLTAPLRAGAPVVALYDGTPAARAALRVAQRLARRGGRALLVLVPSADPERRARLRHGAAAALAGPPPHRVFFQALPRLEAEAVADALERVHADLLVVPRPLLSRERTDGWWTSVERPLLAVEAAEAASPRT
jgi:hypothetical protein